MHKILTLIPSRLSAVRLPNKPLLKINGISLINHVYNKAVNSSLGDVYVVTGDAEIFDEVKKSGGKCILTKKHHKTGTDRIFEGLQKVKRKNYDYILNLQGDEPLISVHDLKNLVNKAFSERFDIGTLGCELTYNKLSNKNIVKVETASELNDSNFSKALDFFREKSNNKIKNNIYHHVGVYIYKYDVLKKFVELKQTTREKKLKLEQMRALENNIDLDVILAKTIPIGVDTLDDFNNVKKIMET